MEAVLARPTAMEAVLMEAVQARPTAMEAVPMEAVQARPTALEAVPMEAVLAQAAPQVARMLAFHAAATLATFSTLKHASANASTLRAQPTRRSTSKSASVCAPLL